MINRARITTSVFRALTISSLAGCALTQNSPVTTGYAAFAGHDEPWQKDLIQSKSPEYSRADRGAWHQGRGVFHLTIDAQTGHVRDVAVKQSTGYQTLDASAVAALGQWRFKPGSWSQLDITVTFAMARTREEYFEKVRFAQQHQRTI